MCIFGCWVILNPGVDASTSLARQESALLDLDGDGYADHVASVADARPDRRPQRHRPHHLLRSSSVRWGRASSWTTRATGTPRISRNHAGAVARVHPRRSPRGRCGRAARHVPLRGGTWDRLEREFYGFGEVVEEIRDVSRGEAIYRTSPATFAVDSFYTRGLLLRERLADAAGRPFHETEHTFEVHDEATQGRWPT